MFEWFESQGSALLEWLDAHKAAIVVASLATFAATLAVIPVLVARMRADYFVRKQTDATSWGQHHPLVRWSILVVKNIVGAVFALMGLVMLLTPGQGILTLLVGISLMNFPGKRRLELRVARLPAVLKSMNWIRQKAGRPPLEMSAD